MIRIARRKVPNAAQAPVATSKTTPQTTARAARASSLATAAARAGGVTRDITRDISRDVVGLVRVPVELVYSTVVVGGFLALLLQDQVHPVMIYLIRMYLSL